MPLVDFKHVLTYARERKLGVAAFNPVDYNSTQAIIDIADELDAPVICQTSAKTVRYYGAASIYSWMQQLCKKTSVPVSLHLDHGKDLDMIESCIKSGWTNVMIDASDLPFEQNLARSKQVYEMAAAHNVSIEAEIGEIHGVEEDIVVESGGSVVDPDKAEIFCKEMDLGVFAPAIGTAHGIYHGEPKIAWDVLEQLSERINTPFALHGGTGLEDDVIQRCISLGCSKVNISTQLKHAFISGFYEHHRENPDDYEPLSHLKAQDQAMREVVRYKMEQFGAAGHGQAILKAMNTQ